MSHKDTAHEKETAKQLPGAHPAAVAASQLHTDAPPTTSRGMGVKTGPLPDGYLQPGDMVCLKSGGPRMTVSALENPIAPGAAVAPLAFAAPGSPATDPEITPERRAAGQTSLPPPLATGGVTCRWFTRDGELRNGTFSASELIRADEKEADAWDMSKQAK